MKHPTTIIVSDDDFNRLIFPLMTADEQEELVVYSICGHRIISGKETIILMGSAGIKRIDDFKELMIEKYAESIKEIIKQHPRLLYQ